MYKFCFTYFVKWLIGKNAILDQTDVAVGPVRWSFYVFRGMPVPKLWNQLNENENYNKDMFFFGMTWNRVLVYITRRFHTIWQNIESRVVSYLLFACCVDLTEVSRTNFLAPMSWSKLSVLNHTHIKWFFRPARTCHKLDLNLIKGIVLFFVRACVRRIE